MYKINSQKSTKLNQVISDIIEEYDYEISEAKEELILGDFDAINNDYDITFYNKIDNLKKYKIESDAILSYLESDEFDQNFKYLN